MLVLYEKLRIWCQVNTVNFIIDDLLRPVTKAILVFDIKWWQNNEKKNNYDLLLPDNGYIF